MSELKAKLEILLGDSLDKIEWHRDEYGKVTGSTAYVSEDKVRKMLDLLWPVIAAASCEIEYATAPDTFKALAALEKELG